MVLIPALFGALSGLLAVLFGPSLSRYTRIGRRVGQGYFEFIAKALKRPGFGVGKHGDVSLVQLSFDQTYDQETITRGGVEKKITHTAKNVHRVGSTPLAFFDEVFGVTFDLRDVLIGQIEHRHREDGSMVRTQFEYGEDEHGDVQVTNKNSFVRAFFEIPERIPVDLNIDESVRPITDGSEKASWWEMMWETVRRMYAHRQEDMSVWKMLIPFGVGGAAFALGYYVIGPGQMPGSGSSAANPISVGLLLLLGGSGGGVQALKDRILGVDWTEVAKGAGLVATIGALAAVGALAGPLVTGPYLLGFIAGAAVLPILVQLFGAIGYGAGLGDLLLWAGLGAFNEPVLDLTADDRYVMREVADLPIENPPKVKIAKRMVALSPDTSPHAFGHAGYTESDVVDYLPDSAMIGDGGSDAVLPRGYTRTEGLTNAGHRGFMPKRDRLDPGTTYVRSDSWLSRFKDAATGDAVDTAELEATKEFANGDPKYGDEQLMRWSAIAAVAGIGFWVVVALAF